MSEDSGIKYLENEKQTESLDLYMQRKHSIKMKAK